MVVAQSSAFQVHNMDDELMLLCAQELLEDALSTASSSDEDEEREQKMNVLTMLCAQNLLEDFLDSSSDEDDDFLAILGYTQLLERTKNLNKCKDKNTVSTKSKPKVGVNKYLLQSRENHSHKDNVSTTVLKESISKTQENVDNLPMECEFNTEAQDNPLLKETKIATLLPKNNVKVNTFENVLQLKRKTNKAAHPTLPFCNLQSTLDEDAIDTLSENEFKQYFHINRESFTYLMDRFSSWYCGKGSHEQSAQKLNIKISLLTFLGFCGNPVSFETATRIFNVPPMDSKDSLNIILDFFEKELASEAIQLPASYMEKEAVAKDFEKIDGFPNVLGCLAVTYFSLQIPELIQICGGPRLVIRGICDSNRKFSNVKIMCVKKSTNDKFFEKELPKLCFPKYHVLGDATCPIRDHLVIPFGNTENLSNSEEFFNTKLCRTHVKIKEAFGNLRNRFRQLQYLDFNNNETLFKFITACCILHNICIDRQDFYDATYTDELCGQFKGSCFSGVQTDDFLADLGLMKRDELKQILFRTKK